MSKLVVAVVVVLATLATLAFAANAAETFETVPPPHHGTTAEAVPQETTQEAGTCADQSCSGGIREQPHHRRGLFPSLANTWDSLFHWPTFDILDSNPWHHHRHHHHPLASHHQPWWPQQAASQYMPSTTLGAVDVVESDNEIKISADTPGMTTSNIGVEVRGNMLTLTGERKETHCEEDKATKAHRCERSFNSFNRSFRLPEGAETDRIHASSKDGVLTVVVPKKPKTSNEPAATKIPIRSG